MSDGSIGGFVYCYVRAGSVRASLDVAEGVLEGDGYRVLDVTHALRIEIEEYEPHDQDHPSREELARALSSGEYFYGPFWCYQAEYEH